MDLQLAGKRALITGSTAGIGFAIAEALAKEGATVIVNGRTVDRVAEAIKKLRAGGIKGAIEDLTADMGTVAGAQLAAEKFPEVEILVNNLGIFEPKSFEEISDADWFKFFEVNVMSGVRLSRQYLPKMKQRDWGRIIF
ncbi:MAG: oxidoreductase, partial [Candidatus Angelobacter sp.]|nr:oxidoreductase [Candidatus Angelobacter sp.]